MDREHTPREQERTEARPETFVWIALALCTIDQAFDSVVAAVVVASVTGFALVRWRSEMSRGALIVAIGILVITLLDFVDRGLLPVIRIR